jgi:hypothetical protein
MEILITIPDYKPETGFKFVWEPGFEIIVEKGEDYVRLSANKEGLISLANHFLNLAQDQIPSGYHFHLDEFNSLEEGSCELILQKT